MCVTIFQHLESVYVTLNCVLQTLAECFCNSNYFLVFGEHCASVTKSCLCFTPYRVYGKHTPYARERFERKNSNIFRMHSIDISNENIQGKRRSLVVSYSIFSVETVESFFGLARMNCC